MRIPRILVRQPLESGVHLSLPPQAAQHVHKVLRLRADHPVVIFDGRGKEHEGVLAGDGEVLIGEATGRDPESPLSICLVQGISRGQRMDYSLQKAVELGVTRIQPVFCERSVVQLDGKRLAKRMQHWQGIIESACEQSGRTRLPELDRAADLTALESIADSCGLFLDPEADRSLTAFRDGQRFSLVVGPEGGLSAGEIRALQDKGYRGASLGPRILRTETAGVAALSVLQALNGDLR